MIYAATVISAGVKNSSAFVVKPKYTRIDGTDALNIEALPLSGLLPSVGDIVFCAENINDFDQETQQLINKNMGAFPLIFASLASPIIYQVDFTLLGKMVLGEGTYKMVLGDALEDWLINTLKTYIDSHVHVYQGTAVVGGVSGTSAGTTNAPLPPLTAPTGILSENHTLD